MDVLCLFSGIRFQAEFEKEAQLTHSRILFGGEKETGGGREAGSDLWKAYMRRATNNRGCALQCFNLFWSMHRLAALSNRRRRLHPQFLREHGPEAVLAVVINLRCTNGWTLTR